MGDKHCVTIHVTILVNVFLHNSPNMNKHELE